MGRCCASRTNTSIFGHKLHVGLKNSTVISIPLNIIFVIVSMEENNDKIRNLFETVSKMLKNCIYINPLGFQKECSGSWQGITQWQQWLTYFHKRTRQSFYYLKSKIQCDRKREKIQDNWTFILLKTSRWVESEWTRMMLFIFDCEIHVRENVCHRFRPDGQIYLFKREYKKKKTEK